MQSNLRGELTCTTEPAMQDFDLVDAVARSLKLTSPKELNQLGATLFPAMLNTAVLDGDIKKVTIHFCRRLNSSLILLFLID